jgi:glutathione peroxidase
MRNGEKIMSIYDFTVKDVHEKEISLGSYKGKVLLIVNTATGCGFTPQYEGLENLYSKYKDQGFEILDFPCNQFLGQAPGTNDEIVSFCQLNFGVSFKTFSKIEVNGDNADPLYEYLKSEAPVDLDNGQMDSLRNKLKEHNFVALTEKEIQWNFTKFLIDQEGNIINRFAPTIIPEDIDLKISNLLNK